MSTSSNADNVVIVGAGLAGGDLAFALRQQGYPGRITLIGQEAELPYRRPPLSKAYLAGETTAESLLIRPAAAYEKHEIECWTGVAVEEIDRSAHRIMLSDGRSLPYHKLVLATGGRPRRLQIPGTQKPNVHYIRTIRDVDALKSDFKPSQRLLVVGGGYIGLEVAAVGIKMGLGVTVIESQPRVLARVCAPELSSFYESAHRSRGVDIRTGVGVKEFLGDPVIDTVQLNDGTRISVDLVVIGIGLVPNTELAEAAGLPVDNGIIVDEHASTLDSDILAIGDCANHVNRFLDRSVRLESVPSAQEQARTAAATILGKPSPNVSVPWFWSDQFDLKLQMVGLSQGYDRLVIRGNQAAESFSAFYLRDNRILAVDAVNRPQDFAIAKRLVASRAKVDPAILANEAIPLKTLLAPNALDQVQGRECK